MNFWAVIAQGDKTDDAAVAGGVSSPVGYRWVRHARRIGRSASTISRELRRNASPRTFRLEYKASIAQWHAERRSRRPKVAKLAGNQGLRDTSRTASPVGSGQQRVGCWVRRGFSGRARTSRIVLIGAGCAWSPEQIARRLPVDFPDDESMRISHEAIYQSLYVEGRGALKSELVACLRSGRALRIPRARVGRRAWDHVTDDVLISERPAEVEDRAVPGHWEGDLVIGLERTAIGTLGQGRSSS